MKYLIILALGSLLVVSGCHKKEAPQSMHVRGLVDTVGFAHRASQMEVFMQRVNARFSEERKRIWQKAHLSPQKGIPLAISPHDDYTYAGDVYTTVLPLVRASTVVLVGVAHRAKRFGIENRIVFGRFPYWHGPWGPVPVSSLREELLQQLPDSLFLVHDSLQAIEHSLEAIVPFLQYYNRRVKILPFLVPYMPFQRMKTIARPLAQVLARLIKSRGWLWGKDIAIVISTDAVHYGDQGWGGENFAYYGADSAGYQKAVAHEMQIIHNCLEGPLSEGKVKRFTNYTVQSSDYHKYRWTWCGRYSVPFGLLLGLYLSREIGWAPPVGHFLKYSTSIAKSPIRVADLKMGITAPANIHHWVGYVAMAYTVTPLR